VQAAVPFEFEGRRVLLIDMPGFDDTTKSDADILKMIAQFLSITQVHIVYQEMAGT
jgi:pimeloyl-ACP methyl ester carboxylesterase